jgi:hypothetical protein
MVAATDQDKVPGGVGSDPGGGGSDEGAVAEQLGCQGQLGTMR